MQRIFPIVREHIFAEMKRFLSKMWNPVVLAGAVIASRKVLNVSSSGIVMKRDLATELRGGFPQLFCVQKRYQSAVTDKKFHCSVCKKGFRLEMAAKVHIQQAHNGEGTVEMGVGPGQSSDFSPQVPIRSVPPKAPVKLSELVTEEKKPARRARPTPKPLHDPDRNMPASAMEEMLNVWDNVGLKRLGSSFVHSSMIMKVFAAKPSEGADLIYEKVLARGKNPFTGEKQYAVKFLVRRTSPASANKKITYALNVAHPFALSVGDYCNPFRPGRMVSPFGRTRVAPEYTSATSEGKEGNETDNGKAPLTPFGQLPLFGQEIEIKVDKREELSRSEPSNESSTVASPLSGMANSPFARAAATPFSSSPFTSHESPIESSSPTSAQPPSSPFTTAEGTSSPFSSEFSTQSSPFKPSDAGQEVLPLFTDPSSTMETPEVGFKCKTCDRIFESFLALRMHSKAKHNISLPASASTSGKKRDTPDIPAYIPSPVNLSLTSPFKSVCNASWPDVDVNIFTQSISNTTLIGCVDEVELLRPGISQIVVSVCNEIEREDDKITVHCFGNFHQLVSETIKRTDKVFVCGSLRLLPVYEQANKKYYSCPVIHVALPTGTIAKIE